MNTETITYKQLVIAAFDLASIVFVSLLLNVCMPCTAYAYVDPSVMTYTIQAVAGVAVALGAVAGVAFRRTRRALFKLLKIDENANKTVEQDVTRIEASPTNMAMGVERFGGSSEETNAKAGNQSAVFKVKWPARFGLAFLVSAFCALTVLFVAPVELIAGASGDLLFGLSDVWGIMLAFALAVSLVVSLVLSIFRGKWYLGLLTFALCVGCACYIQVAFLNGGLPEANGKDVNWVGDHMTSMVVSAIVWLVVIVVPLIVCLKKPRVTRAVVACLSVALLIVQGVGVASLFIGDDGASANGPIVVTEDGLFEVSDKANVVVFVLDNYDTKVFEQVFRDDPAMLEQMDGFVWYKNSAGVMIPTSFAVPYLLTGIEPDENEDLPTYLERRYTESSFLEDLHATNYSIGVYTDTFGLAYLDDDQEQTEIYDNVMNIHPVSDPIRVSPKDTILLLTRCSLYRDMPWVLKPRFWFYTDELNTRIPVRSDGGDPSQKPYYIDDAGFFGELQMRGLAVQGGDYDGAFRFIHMLGAHSPYNLDEMGNNVGVGNSDQERQARGSMRMVGDYLRRLKEMGLYEKTAVIITSDHGDWRASMGEPTESTEPILLYKPAGELAFEGVRESSAPVSHADFQASVLDAMGADYSSYGATYSEYGEDDARIRNFYHITHDDHSRIRSLMKYEISGDVLDFDNWRFTGQVWETNYNNDLR